MAQFDLPAGARPVGAEIPDGFLAPLTEATAIALREVASTEVAPGPAFLITTPVDFGQRSALIDLNFPFGKGTLVLSVPEAAAAVLANRVLVGQDIVIDAPLIEDCLGEIANVIAGQGKAMLYGTEWHYTFGTPRAASPSGLTSVIDGQLDWLVLSFRCELGTIFLQVTGVTTAK